MKIHGPAPFPQNGITSASLKAAAMELEATFLAEMMKSAGLGKSRQSFGGGAGEDQFASFLVEHQVNQLTQSGGVGLAEVFLKSMMENADVR